MSKGIIAGVTDYSYQSLSDIKDDLRNEAEFLSKTVELLENNIQDLKKSGYWDEKVNSNFKNISLVSLHHSKTAIEEFEDILSDISSNVEKHHCHRLRNIAEFASETNSKIGEIWHQDYKKKEYGNSEFRKIEKIYQEARDAAVNLLDIANIAERLEDFIGRAPRNEAGKIYKFFHNPWTVGIGVGIIVLFLAWLIGQYFGIAL